MWLKWQSLVFLVLLHFIKSQEITNSGENERHVRQLDTECCPCPGSAAFNRNDDEDVDISADEMDGSESGRTSAVDDCPCRVRGADADPASSILFPTAVRASRPLMRTESGSDDTKPLLHPEVNLASSVLETLREATDEEYKEALARDANKDDSAPEESVGNIVTIIMSPMQKANSIEDVIPEASHVQETRCTNSMLERTRNMGMTESASNDQPTLLNKVLRSNSLVKPTVSLFRSVGDEDSSVEASNAQEVIAGSLDKGKQMLNLKSRPSLFNLFPESTIPTSRSILAPLKNMFNLRDRSLGKNTDDACANNRDVTNLKDLDLSTKILEKATESKSISHSSIINPSIPSLNFADTQLGQKDMITDSGSSPSIIQEQFVENERNSNRAPTFKSLIESDKKAETIIPQKISNLLNLRDVELVPPKTLLERVFNKTKLLPDLKLTKNLLNHNSVEDKSKSGRLSNFKLPLFSNLLRNDVEVNNNAELKECLNKGRDVRPETDIETIVDPNNPETEFFDAAPSPTELIHQEMKNYGPRETNTVQHSIEAILDKAASESEEYQTVQENISPKANEKNDFFSEEVNISVENNEDENTMVPTTAIETCILKKEIDQEADTSNINFQIINQDNENISIESSDEATETIEDLIERNESHADIDRLQPGSGENLSNAEQNDRSFVTPFTKIDSKLKNSLIDTLNTMTRLEKLRKANTNLFEKSSSPTKLWKAEEQNLNKLSDTMTEAPKLFSAEVTTTMQPTFTQLPEDFEAQPSNNIALSKVTESNDPENLECKSDIFDDDESSKKFSTDVKSNKNSDVNIQSEEQITENDALEESNDTPISVPKEDTDIAVTRISDNLSSEVDSDSTSQLKSHFDKENSCKCNMVPPPEKTEKSDTANDLEKQSTSNLNLEPKEMATEASDPIAATETRPNWSSENEDISFPLRQDFIVQPTGLFNGINLDGLRRLTPNIGNIFGNLNTGLPTLEDISKSLLGSGRSAEETADISSDCDSLNESPVMSTGASTSNLRLSKPLIKPLEDIDLDIFQLKPLTYSSPLTSRIPGLNLNTYKAKLALPKSLQLKPLSLESALGNKGGLLGARMIVGPDKADLKLKLFDPQLLKRIQNPIQNLPTLTELADNMKTNTAKLLKNPVSEKLNPRNYLKSGPLLRTLSDNLKMHADNTMKGIQSLASTAAERKDTFAKSEDLIEQVSSARQNIKDKLQAMHIDLSDRLTSLRDQSNLPSLKVPVFRNGMNLQTKPSFRSATSRNRESGLQSLKRKDANLSVNKAKPILGNYNDNSEATSRWGSLQGNSDEKKINNRPKLKTVQPNKGSLSGIRSKDMEAVRPTRVQGKSPISSRKQFRPINTGSFQTTTRRPTAPLPPFRSKSTLSLFSTPKPMFARPGLLKTIKPPSLPRSSFSRREPTALRSSSRADTEVLPSELIPTRISVPVEMVNEAKSTDANADTNIESDSPQQPSLKSINKTPNGRLTKTEDIVSQSKNPSISSKTTKLPSARTNALLEKMKEAVKARLSGLGSNVAKSSEVKKPSDMTNFASENREVAAVEPTKNLSFKCKMVCVRD